MSENNYLRVLLLISLYSVVISQWLPGSCDFNKYLNGCEDDFGAECDITSSPVQCRCKAGNGIVVDNRFCFPIQCPKGQYYDHNHQGCQPQRKASTKSEDNGCKYDFHCKGDHIHCQLNDWSNKCVCDPGFAYNQDSQQCQKDMKGANHGFCVTLTDCDTSGLRHMTCVNNTCQCQQDYTYNNVIDGCESNEIVAERDRHTRKMIYLFIGLGLFFGAALSLKFGTNSAAATQQMLLKQVLERRAKEREQQRQQRLEEQEESLHPQEAVIDLSDRSENLINNRETA